MKKIITLILFALCVNAGAADRFTAKLTNCPPDGVASKCFDTIRYGSLPVFALTGDERSALAFAESEANNGALGKLGESERKAIKPVSEFLCNQLGFRKNLSFSTHENSYAVEAIPVKFIDGVMEDLKPETSFEIGWSDGQSSMTLEPLTFERIRCQ